MGRPLSDRPIEERQRMLVHSPAFLLVVDRPHLPLAPNGHRGMGRWSGVQSEGSWCARQRYGLDPACSK